MPATAAKGATAAPTAFKPFDIVVVPFPFTDRNASKKRPALVLSSAAFGKASGHCVLAMITSAEQPSWPGDLPIADLKSTGLTQACRLRMKLFTLDQRLIIRVAGRLSKTDQHSLRALWPALLPAL